MRGWALSSLSSSSSNPYAAASRTPVRTVLKRGPVCVALGKFLFGYVGTMPFICIGPVCIPWTAFVPIFMYLGRPIWNRCASACVPRHAPASACIDSRARRSACRLPPSTQKRLAAWAAQVNSVVQPYRDALQVQLWDRVGWKAKALKPPAAAKAPAAAGALATDMAALRAQLGSVVGVHSEEEWAAAMALSAELPVIVDFTATWCAPATRRQPRRTEAVTEAV